jgi:hypothetical protein
MAGAENLASVARIELLRNPGPGERASRSRVPQELNPGYSLMTSPVLGNRLGFVIKELAEFDECQSPGRAFTGGLARINPICVSSA